MEELRVEHPDVTCHFCRQSSIKSLEWGSLYKYDDVVVHYFCLLLSPTSQKGADDEGIWGFLLQDIRNETRNSSNLVCKYCKTGNANLKCNWKGCGVKCHFTCGYENDATFSFTGQFPVRCSQHKMKQKYMETQIWVCPVCYHDVTEDEHPISLQCCYLGVAHRLCLLELASTAGYFFKCPLCMDKVRFRRHVQTRGVFIPQRDAAWELEEGAFADHYVPHSRCDACKCLCPEGRNYETRRGDEADGTSDLTDWNLARCTSCGGCATHVKCGRITSLSSWNCPTCSNVGTARENEDVFAGETDYEDAEDENNPGQHSLLSSNSAEQDVEDDYENDSTQCSFFALNEDEESDKLNNNEHSESSLMNQSAKVEGDKTTVCESILTPDMTICEDNVQPILDEYEMYQNNACSVVEEVVAGSEVYNSASVQYSEAVEESEDLDHSNYVYLESEELEHSIMDMDGDGDQGLGSIDVTTSVDMACPEENGQTIDIDDNGLKETHMVLDEHVGRVLSHENDALDNLYYEDYDVPMEADDVTITESQKPIVVEDESREQRGDLSTSSPVSVSCTEVISDSTDDTDHPKPTRSTQQRKTKKRKRRNQRNSQAYETITVNSSSSSSDSDGPFRRFPTTRLVNARKQKSINCPKTSAINISSSSSSSSVTELDDDDESDMASTTYPASVDKRQKNTSPLMVDNPILDTQHLSTSSSCSSLMEIDTDEDDTKKPTTITFPTTTPKDTSGKSAAVIKRQQNAMDRLGLGRSHNVLDTVTISDDSDSDEDIKIVEAKCVSKRVSKFMRWSQARKKIIHGD